MDRLPIDVTLSGGPASGRRLVYEPEGSADVLMVAVPPTIEEMARVMVSPDPDESYLPRVAEYRLAWGEWLTFDEGSAFQRGLSPGRHLIRGVYEYNGTR